MTTRDRIRYAYAGWRTAQRKASASERIADAILVVAFGAIGACTLLHWLGLLCQGG